MWVVVKSIDASLAKTTHVLLADKTPGPGCVGHRRMLQLIKTLLAHVTPLGMRPTPAPVAFPPSGSDGRNQKLLAFPSLPRRST